LSPFVHITRKVSTKLYVAEPGRVLADRYYLFATALKYGSLPILFGVSCSHWPAIAATSIFYVEEVVLYGAARSRAIQHHLLHTFLYEATLGSPVSTRKSVKGELKYGGNEWRIRIISAIM